MARREGTENMNIEQLTLTIAAGVALLALLPVLPQFVNLFPMLWAGLLRTATCIRIEDSKKVQRSRDLVFWLSIPSLITTVWRCGLYTPEWMETLPSDYRLPCIAGIVLGYILLCLALGHMMPFRRFSAKVRDAAVGCPKNFGIMLTFALFLAAVFLKSANVGTNASLILMYCITGVLYLMFLIRRFQIFAYDSNYLTAILYLCSLEILPTALLVISAVIF